MFNSYSSQFYKYIQGVLINFSRRKDLNTYALMVTGNKLSICILIYVAEKSESVMNKTL